MKWNHGVQFPNSSKIWIKSAEEKTFMDKSTQNLFNTTFCESYGDSEQIELQHNRKPELQKKDACDYQD